MIPYTRVCLYCHFYFQADILSRYLMFLYPCQCLLILKTLISGQEQSSNTYANLAGSNTTNPHKVQT